MKNYQITLSIFLITISFFYAFSAWAALVPCGGEGQPQCTLCHLWQMGSNIINFLIWELSLPIAALLFIAAGVVFLTAGGNESRVALGKSIFTNTVIGLVIIFCAWLLIDTLFKTLASGTFSTAWNQFPVCP